MGCVNIEQVRVRGNGEGAADSEREAGSCMREEVNRENGPDWNIAWLPALQLFRQRQALIKACVDSLLISTELV